MHTLKRRLYKRGSSFEVTIPMPILFGLDLESKHNITFYKKADKWLLLIDKKADSKQSITRNLYKRGSSYETTIPIQLILHLNPRKSYYVVFKFDNVWEVLFEEAKNEK